MAHAAELTQEAPSRDLAEVYRLHAADVERWAARLGGPNVDVDDVVQDVFMVVHQQLGRFREGEARLSTWLFRITENVVCNQRRKNRWRKWLKGDAKEAAGEVPLKEEDASQRLEQAQSHAEVYSILNGMPEKYRTVLILFEMEQKSGEEIAELTGAKVGTVWVWLHRARAEFLRRLQERQGRKAVHET